MYYAKVGRVDTSENRRLQSSAHLTSALVFAAHRWCDRGVGGGGLGPGATGGGGRGAAAGERGWLSRGPPSRLGGSLPCVSTRLRPRVLLHTVHDVL